MLSMMKYIFAVQCHASHEACELKFLVRCKVFLRIGHASHEACELKSRKS